MPNRLIKETSPYLLQHAHNPVDWHPWGAAALNLAQEKDKPILLSVGYSACHWCHVMERESFENEEIASIMNDNFISIKVDREERPDIDSIYMTAVQTMTGQGGWPMTVFLTPTGSPFYGGTYFPPEDRGGLPAFPKLLVALAEAYNEKRDEIQQSTDQLVQHMRHLGKSGEPTGPLTKSIELKAYQTLAKQFDNSEGGFGLQPKFPQPMVYEFLLRHYLNTQDPDVLDMVELTLTKMAKGGIYDQLGGGFHRYSTDSYWQVPHFEKMLYDNALLARLYLHLYQITGKSLYRSVVEQTLEYVGREMMSPEGGFYSAQDADSEGEEGKFFVWRPEEINHILGKEDGHIITQYYGVSIHGNFEGHSILHVTDSQETFSKRFGLSVDAFNALLESSKERLYKVRDKRVHPGLDDKILSSWNGLMLASFAEAASVLGRDDFRQIAEDNAKFIINNLISDTGRLLRTYKNDQSKLNAYLEDYGALIDGLLLLHEATSDGHWLDVATDLGKAMVDLFWDENEELFYDTGHDHEKLVVRPRDYTDNAMPCGSSMATSVLLRLAIVTGDQEYERIAEISLNSMLAFISRSPVGTGNWLCALDFYLSSPREIAIVGGRSEDATRALVAEVYRHFLPNRVVLGKRSSDAEYQNFPLLTNRPMLNNQPTAYVCEKYLCLSPVTIARDLAIQLTR